MQMGVRNCALQEGTGLLFSCAACRDVGGALTPSADGQNLIPVLPRP